jgi:hypothetical protein
MVGEKVDQPLNRVGPVRSGGIRRKASNKGYHPQGMSQVHFRNLLFPFGVKFYPIVRPSVNCGFPLKLSAK